MLSDRLLETYQEKYQGLPELTIKAPGRINLIGDHTDYNMGFVLPAAIDYYTWFLCSSNSADHISITSSGYGETFELSPDVKSITHHGWQKYVEAVCIILQEQGYRCRGFDMVIGGNIPIGAGLSSSAALTCGLIYAISSLFDLEIPKADIARFAQAAEIRIGLNCGLMDQYAVLESRKNHCLLLDCQSLAFDFLPADFPGYSLVLVNSNVTHHLAESEYNHRRADVERAIQGLKEVYPSINSPRDLNAEMLNASGGNLDDTGRRRLSFVLDENQRVLDTSQALRSGNITEVGRLMNASHEGLSRLYEVSCPELDFLAAFAQDKDYIAGSRMMGGGFGGCTINLVSKGRELQFMEEVGEAYQNQMDQKATTLLVSIGEGVHRVAP